MRNLGQTTGPILLGTSKGLIFETEINPNGSEAYWKQVIFHSQDIVENSRTTPCRFSTSEEESPWR